VLAHDDAVDMQRYKHVTDSRTISSVYNAITLKSSHCHCSDIYCHSFCHLWYLLDWTVGETRTIGRHAVRQGFYGSNQLILQYNFKHKMNSSTKYLVSYMTTNYMKRNMIFRGPCIVTYSYNKTNGMH